MQAIPERELHQLVIRGVVLDLVDAVAGAVVGAELGRVAVRLVREQLHALAADELAEVRRLIVDPPAAFAGNGRAEDRVPGPRVVADERRGLVRDLVRGAGEADGVEVVEAVVHRAPEAGGNRMATLPEPDAPVWPASGVTGDVGMPTFRHPPRDLTMFNKGARARPRGADGPRYRGAKNLS